MNHYKLKGIVFILTLASIISMKHYSSIDGKNEIEQFGPLRVGLLSDSGELESSIGYAPELKTDDLPSTVDLSSQLPPSLNQYNQASSVGFVLGYSLKSFTENQKSSSPKTLSKLSLVQGLEEGKFFSPAYIYNTTNDGKDQGGSLLEGLIVLSSHGILTWKDLPYRIDDYRNRSFLDNQKSLKYRISDFKKIRISDLKQIKAYLDSGHPLPASLLFYEGYISYNNSSPIKKYSGEFLGAQAVLIAGYDDSKNAFLFQNSWGQEWGDKGYGWIDYQLFQKTAQSLYWVHDPPLLPNPKDLKSGYPKDIVASLGNFKDRVRLSWTNVQGAIGYEIYRKRTVGGNYELVGISLESSFEDRGVQPDLAYHYQVATVFPDESSQPYPGNIEGYSSTDPKQTSTMKITGLSASQGKHIDRVTLNWNPIPDTKYYHLYKYNPSSKQYRLLSKTSIPEFVDRKAKNNGSMEFYRVSVAGSYSNSSLTPAVIGYTSRRSLILPPPKDVRASKGDYSDRIKIQWSQVSGADKYKIYSRSFNDENWKEIAFTDANEFEDRNPKDSNLYYSIAVMNKLGLFSRGSTPVVGSISKKKERSLGLSPPEKIEASLLNRSGKKQVRLSWKPVAGTENYNVYMRFEKGNWRKLDSTSSNYHIQEIPQGKFHLFSISAVDKYGIEGQKSKEIPFAYLDTVKDTIKHRSFGSQSNLEKFKGPWTTMYWDGKASITELRLIIEAQKEGEETCKILFNNRMIYKGEYIQETEISDPKGRFQIAMGDSEQALQMEIKDKNIFPETTTLSFLRE